MVELFDISLRYGAREVLSNISLFFSEYRITALLGRSGSGKSSLLQIINGTVRPSSGRVTVFGAGFDYQNASATRLRIGYAVQQAGLFPHLTVFENIGLLGKIASKSRGAIEDRVSELMDIVQLPRSYFKKYPHELSGGEAQRVGLCRALFLKPSLLLMDEPFAALDFDTKATIYQYFLRLQEREPCTVVLVTHDWQEAATLAGEFVWLDAGVIKSRGTKQDLIRLAQENASA